MDLHNIAAFNRIKENEIPIVYGPMDSLAYKVELKHESWRNVEFLMKSGAKFSMMSDHPVILQRNIFLTMRHFLRFGMEKAEAISKLTSEAAEILGVSNLGSIKPGFLPSMVLWNEDPFSMTSHPVRVIAEGNVVYDE